MEPHVGTVAQRLTAFFSFLACAGFLTALIGSKFQPWASYVVFEDTGKGFKEPDYWGYYGLVDATFANTTAAATFPLRDLPRVIPGASSAVGDSGFCTLFLLCAAAICSLVAFANVLTYRVSIAGNAATFVASLLAVACAAGGLFAFFAVFIVEVQSVHAPYIAKHAGVGDYVPRTSMGIFPWFAVGGAGCAVLAAVAACVAVIQTVREMKYAQLP